MCTAQLLGSPPDHKQRTTVSRPCCNRLLVHCVPSTFTTMSIKNEGNKSLNKSISYNSVLTHVIKHTQAFARKRWAGDKKCKCVDESSDGSLLGMQIGLWDTRACVCNQQKTSIQAHSDLVLSTVTGHAVPSCFQLYVKLSATNSIIEMEKKINTERNAPPNSNRTEYGDSGILKNVYV